MKKFLILVLICFAQNTFSQNTKTHPKKTPVQNKEPEIVTIKPGTNSDAMITIDEPVSNSQTAIEEDNAIYNTAGIEVKPDFPGGMEKFYAFVDANFKKPETASNIQGKKIYITFIVEKDGALTDIKVLRDAGYETGAEAIRVLKNSPKWNPGEHNGKKIRVLFSLPIVMK